AAATWAAGCAGTTAPAPAAASSAGSVADLGRPWSEIPYDVAPDVLRSAEGACREQSPDDIPAGSPLALVDGRGGARLILVFAPPGAGVSCDAKINADRSWTAVVHPGIDAPVPAAGHASVELLASSSDIRPIGIPKERTTLFGRSGPGVVSVDVLVGESVVRATTADGWFVAWWPTDEAAIAIQARDAAGRALEAPHA
ncbi:MAG TPA: hypothetical protein VH440_14145, partial [Candidatus Limnocylindrales bacterium]